MNLKLQVKTLDLFTKLVNGNLNKIAYIEYTPQKAKFQKRKNSQPLPRSTPEEQGISSLYLKSFLEELRQAPTVHTQGIMITRNGSVILEGAFKPYDLDTWRITHSLCKTLVGIATGIAIEEGFFHIDDTVASIFNKTYLPIIGTRKKDITIRNLLSMSSGIAYNEIGSVIDTEWTQSFLESQMSFEPGKEFSYNSMNTYMLSAIIQEKTGQSLIEFLKTRLFMPLGIDNIHWEESPEKKNKGGWGLYITLEDRTKLGQLILNKGHWNGNKIVSESWITSMLTKSMDTPQGMNEYGYGYQGWIGKRNGSFIFNGVLGQNTIVYPDLNMVISIISSNTDMFVKSSLMEIVDKYFATPEFRPDMAIRKERHNYALLQNYMTQLCFQEEFKVTEKGSRKRNGWQRFLPKKRNLFPELLCDIPDNVEDISFSRYYVDANDASVVPLFVQTMQNNFSQGITKFQFQKKDGMIVLLIEEHELKWEIPIGFKRAKYSVLDLHGEFYDIAAWGVLKKTEEDVPVLKLQISFLETTNCRNMRFYFYKDSALIKLNEIPDPDALLDQVIPFLKFALPANGIETIKNTELVKGKVAKMVEPEVNAFPMN